MNWYLSKIIFRIISGDGGHTPQFDEQLRLVSADSTEEAFAKAQKLGTGGEDTFYNAKEQLVRWQFINVSEIHLLTDLRDGSELYSRIEEQDSAEAYIHTIHQKAEKLHEPRPLHILKLA